MGGSKSQPQQKQAPTLDPMIAFMAMQQQQQAAQAAAAAEAQRQAQIQAQTQAGQQAQFQSETAARQSLADMNTAQQAQDKSTLAAQPASNAGNAATGGGMDVNATRQASLQQMGAGAAAAGQPTMTTATGMANQGVGGTQQKVNQFATPTATGLTFGGS